MKRVSSAFRNRIAAAALGAVAIAAGAAGLRASLAPASLAAGSPDTVAGAAAQGASVPAQAMRAGIDPETGLLGMPPADAAKAIDLPAAPGALPPVEVLADGTQILRGKGHFLNYSVLHLDGKGGHEIVCTASAEAATQCVHGAPARAATAPAPVTSTATPVAPVAQEVR